MANHNNYANDRDLMMEAYASVEGEVPATSSTAMPRMLNESGCASHSDEEKITEIEIGGNLYEVGGPDPSNESELIISIEKHSNGYMITTGQFSSPEDFVTKGPDSAVEAGGYALSLDGQPMDEDDLEDGLGHAEDNEGSLKNEVLAAIKAKAAEYGGNKGAMAHAAQELAAEYEQAGEAEKASIAKNQGAVFATFREDNEGEAGFTSTQKEELEDIVHAILDKRDSEERAAEHYR